MLRIIISGIFLLLASRAVAQKIPEKVIEEWCESAKADGYTIERMIKPDFTKANPNEAMWWDGPCYPGKTVVVALLTASKPQDLFFTIQVYAKPVAQKSNLHSLTINGTAYWNDFRVAKFGEEYANYKNTQKCLTIFGYDRKALDLPMYLFVMTRK
jgi:hypothetical protein